ncbi:cysteine hydrolase family protein [Catellatospora tritici]|uniref:cysteine hydrolase family protein n=1 Tax=Catellatospora tritici TaxID=2851566 RepID=UPI0027E179E6|nr:cysteine hydrolase [Catellatospora tritici]
MDRYDSATTGLIISDPYNDFISAGGKLWPQVKEVAEAVGAVEHMRQVAAAARAAGIRVFYSRHRRWQPGDYDTWAHPTQTQLRTAANQLFAVGTWGGQWHPDFEPQPGDVLISEHWAQSGFANTDLDQQLKQHAIQKIIIVGMVANTCVESTGRYGMELGYHVTLVRDATAAFRMDAMRAAHEINGPAFAHHITTTEPLVAALG